MQVYSKARKRWVKLPSPDGMEPMIELHHQNKTDITFRVENERDTEFIHTIIEHLKNRPEKDVLS